MKGTKRTKEKRIRSNTKTGGPARQASQETCPISPPEKDVRVTSRQACASQTDMGPRSANPILPRLVAKPDGRRSQKLNLNIAIFEPRIKPVAEKW